MTDAALVVCFGTAVQSIWRQSERQGKAADYPSLRLSDQGFLISEAKLNDLRFRRSMARAKPIEYLASQLRQAGEDMHGSSTSSGYRVLCSLAVQTSILRISLQLACR